MKIGRIFLLCILTLIILTGCQPPMGSISDGGGDAEGPEPPPGPDTTFWTIDLAKDYISDPSAWLQIGANLVKEGTKCLVFLENGKTISGAIIDSIAAEFDTPIWNTVNNNFSSPTDRDSNNKIILFLLDIKDNYNPPAFTGYTGGYFYAIDLFSNSELAGLGYPAYFKSNEAEILYIDINPSDPASAANKSIVIHEFQHLASASQNVIREASANLPTWMNEGFSMGAESIYQGVYLLSSRENWYNNDPLYTGAGGVTPDIGKSISYGYPLVLWNIYSSNGYAVFNNYALSNLFYAWLRIHMGSDNFFKTIHDDSNNTVQAVIDACSPTLGAAVDTFPKMLRTWWMANLLAGSGNNTGLESYLGLNNHAGPYAFSGAGGSIGIYASGAIHFINSAYNNWSPSGGDAQIGYALGDINTYSSDYTAPFGTGTAIPEIMIVHNTESEGLTIRTSAVLPAISLPLIMQNSAKGAGHLKANGLVFMQKKSLPFAAFRKGREPIGIGLPVPNNRLR